MSIASALYRESMGDDVRRRITPVIIAVCIFSIMMLDGCTSCATGEVMVDGKPTAIAELAGGVGIATMVVLGLWIMVLAGVLAADHLRQTLEDGSANLCLARPVSRGTFALSRLAGVLSLTWLAGAALFGTTAGLLAVRGGLPVAPAAWAALACASGTIIVGALAMAASLLLPRLGAILLTLMSIGAIAMANGVEAIRKSGDGLLGMIDRVGPPVATAMANALSSWVPGVEIPGDPLLLGLRLALWCGISLAALQWAFSRMELGR
jgi:hypothetical protein